MRSDGKTLENMAAERGITVDQLIADAVSGANGRTFKAAIDLDMYPSAIYGWLKRNGKVIRLRAEVVPVGEGELEAVNE